MAFWDIDLTTRAGASGAAAQGGLACFVFSGMAVLGLVVFGGLAGYGTPEGIATIIGAGIEIVLGLVAGFRLREGKGAYWGIAVGVFMVLELVAKVVMFSPGGAIIVVVLLVLLVNGVRGALALKRQVGFEDDDVEVFS